MKTIVVLVTLLGWVNAQSEVEVSSNMEKLETTLESIAGMDLKIQGDVTKVDEITSQALNAVATSKVLSVRINQTEQLLKELQDMIEEEKKDFAAQAQAIKDAAIQVQTDDGKVKSEIASQLKLLEAEETKATSLLTKMIKVATDAQKTKQAALVTAKNKEIVNYRDINRNIWMGGSKIWGGGGWKEFVIDRTEAITSSPYFAQKTATRFRALQSGLYRINYWGIQQGGNCHGHGQFYINGRAINNPYHNMLNNGGWWGDLHMDITYYIKKDQEFWLRLYSCGHAWHAATQGNPQVYNRLYVEYMGDVESCAGRGCQ